MSGFNSYQTIRHADKQVYELFDSAYNKNMSHSLLSFHACCSQVCRLKQTNNTNIVLAILFSCCRVIIFEKT